MNRKEFDSKFGFSRIENCNTCLYFDNSERSCSRMKEYGLNKTEYTLDSTSIVFYSCDLYEIRDYINERLNG